jgi:type I restriction enzyme, S subunit
VNKSLKNITKLGLNNSSATLVPAGTVLFSGSATIGNCAINKIPATTKQGFLNIICNKNHNNIFLLYALKFHKKRIQRLVQTSTFGQILKSHFEKMEMPYPKDIKEEEKIADILLRIEELVQKQQKIIEQVQKLKKGVMQKLLLEGIGHTKFKKINFGSQIVQKIPSDWDIKTLNEMSANEFKSGYAVKLTDYGPGFAIVGMTDLFKNEVLESNDLKTINLTKQTIENFFINRNDLLFARRSLTEEGAGKCVLVSELNSPTIFESSIIKITLDCEKYLPSYVNYFLNSDFGRKIMTRIKQVVAVSGIKSSDLKNIKIPIPKDKEEQREIVSRLSNLDLLIQQEKQYKEKLENLKKGLMQQLLTGEKRVIV